MLFPIFTWFQKDALDGLSIGSLRDVGTRHTQYHHRLVLHIVWCHLGLTGIILPRVESNLECLLDRFWEVAVI